MNSVRPTTGELIDVFWRTVWTFIGALGGTEVASAIFDFDVAAINTIQIAAASALITTVKAYASNKLGTGTAAQQPPPSGLPAPVVSTQATTIKPPPTGPEIP